jgi:17beta-estradiol 17-dehydrogenase / very-long-chain 3-oxoacyl-CoA reductase
MKKQIRMRSSKLQEWYSPLHRCFKFKNKMVLDIAWFICYLVGLYYIYYIITRLYIILTPLLFPNDWTKYGIGSWAVITGATDGIGFGFAQVLAKKGFNIALVSRNAQKLREKAQEIKNEFGVEVREIARDFSKCYENPGDFFAGIVQELRGVDLSILVNNVGTGKNSEFHSLPTEKVTEMLALNIWPIVYMSYLLLPYMMRRKKPCAILNLSSVTGTIPMRNLALYSACKAFDDYFSRTLSEELALYHGTRKSTLIDILSVRPGFVNTPLTSTDKVKPLLISPRACAESALNSLGIANASHCHPKHWLLASILKSIPLSIYNNYLMPRRRRSSKKCS